MGDRQWRQSHLRCYVAVRKPDGETLHTYTFHNMVPIAYKGPDLGMDKGSSVVTESVTFAHYGFSDKLNGESGAPGAGPTKSRM